MNKYDINKHFFGFFSWLKYFCCLLASETDLSLSVLF